MLGEMPFMHRRVPPAAKFAAGRRFRLQLFQFELRTTFRFTFTFQFLHLRLPPAARATAGRHFWLRRSSGPATAPNSRTMSGSALRLLKRSSRRQMFRITRCSTSIGFCRYCHQGSFVFAIGHHPSSIVHMLGPSACGSQHVQAQ